MSRAKKPLIATAAVVAALIAVDIVGSSYQVDYVIGRVKDSVDRKVIKGQA